jgi:hypothetical protein
MWRRCAWCWASRSMPRVGAPRRAHREWPIGESDAPALTTDVRIPNVARHNFRTAYAPAARVASEYSRRLRPSAGFDSARVTSAIARRPAGDHRSEVVANGAPRKAIVINGSCDRGIQRSGRQLNERAPAISRCTSGGKRSRGDRSGEPRAHLVRPAHAQALWTRSLKRSSLRSRSKTRYDVTAPSTVSTNSTFTIRRIRGMPAPSCSANNGWRMRNSHSPGASTPTNGDAVSAP